MSHNKAAVVMHATGADKGESAIGAFPQETRRGEKDTRTQRPGSHLPNNQGKSAGIGAKAPLTSEERRQQAEDEGWFKRLSALEAQPVKEAEPNESQHKKLSSSQLENMDDFDIMDAMERGEW